jgi:hypothetical protein
MLSHFIFSMWGKDRFGFASSFDDMSDADNWLVLDFDTLEASHPVTAEAQFSPDAAPVFRPDNALPAPISDPPAATPGRKCQTRKGEGKEGRLLSPDACDSYTFDHGPAMSRLRALGRDPISLVQVVALCNKLEERGHLEGQNLTHRNRWSKRRKPCAFHWIDENWKDISNYFNQCVL